MLNRNFTTFNSCANHSRNVTYKYKKMNKKLLLILLLLIQIHSFGQSEVIKLLNKANAIEKLIPKNWKVLSTAKGDLNKDGINDLALVIENTDKKYLEINEGGLGRDTINLNPRILGIYFGNIKGEFIKKEQYNKFIILQDSPTMDEPFDGIEILKNGVLKIDFHFWYSAGSWNMSNHTYKFRFQNNKFELIGYDSSDRHRGTGETIDYSINFSTRRMNIWKMTIDENDIQRTEDENKSFELKNLKSIQSLGTPFEWKFNDIRI